MKKKRQAAEADVALTGIENTEVLIASYKDNTSQGRGWIFDSDSTVYVCFQKELFNSLIVKKEGTIKMVDGLACKVIGTGTVRL